MLMLIDINIEILQVKMLLLMYMLTLYTIVNFLKSMLMLMLMLTLHTDNHKLSRIV